MASKRKEGKAASPTAIKIDIAQVPAKVLDVLAKMPKQKRKSTRHSGQFQKGNQRGKATRFKLGEIRNPTGGNSAKPFQTACKKIADLKMDDELRVVMKLEQGATWLEGLAMGMFRGGIIKGRPGCAVVIRDSLDGAPDQKLELAGASDPNSIPPTFIVKFVSSHLTPDMTSIPPGPAAAKSCPLCHGAITPGKPHQCP